jgi:hypothetical protein
LLLTCAALFAPAGLASSGAPTLRAVTMQPLAVHGARFRPSEQVTIRALVAGVTRVHVVRASATGTFTTTFTAVTLERCTRYVVIARGSRGSSAMLRPIFPDCAPL